MHSRPAVMLHYFRPTYYCYRLVFRRRLKTVCYDDVNLASPVSRRKIVRDVVEHAALVHRVQFGMSNNNT
jgi:hypothetical protein